MLITLFADPFETCIIAKAGKRIVAHSPDARLQEQDEVPVGCDDRNTKSIGSIRSIFGLCNAICFLCSIRHLCLRARRKTLDLCGERRYGRLVPPLNMIILAKINTNSDLHVERIKEQNKQG